MRRGTKVALACIAGAMLDASGHAASKDATIRWTSRGLPHITASSYEGLGYGYGYAVARDRLCLLADQITTLRGDRSRAYGADQKAVVGFMPTSNLNADLFYRVQLSDEIVAGAMKQLEPRARDIARGYAAGYSRVVKETSPQERERLCKGAPVPQMTEADVVRAVMSIGTIWKAFQIAPVAKDSAWNAGKPQKSAAASPMPEVVSMSASLGSNAWAYGAEVTGNGSAIVVANPHTVWRGHWLSVHQLHLTIPGELDVAGADFLGLPLPLMGFNRDVAWTLEAPVTVTYYVLQALKVEEGEHPAYVVDGKRKPLEIRTVSVPVRQSDGTARGESFQIAYSALGPIYRLPARPGRPAGWYAVTDAADGNARGLNQLVNMARATTVASFVKAIEDDRGMGAHFISGDRHGAIAYVESGPMLDIEDAALETCRAAGAEGSYNVLDGSRSACSVRSAEGRPQLLSAKKFPTLVGRRIIQNTNNSHRFSLYGHDSQGHSRFFGDPKAEPANFRIRMSQRRMGEIVADGKVTPQEALDVVLDNRNYAAETWLADILRVCSGTDLPAEAQRGCSILAKWDRRNDSGSSGALLFGELWQRIGEAPGLFATPSASAKPFDAQPLVATAEVNQKVVAALADTVKALEALKLTGAEPWGQILAARTGSGEKIPLHGGSAEQGVLNVLEGGGLGADGYAQITSGTDYLLQVYWEGGKVVANAVLAHGQSDDPASPHYSDQLGLLSRKQLVRLPFAQADILADPQLKTLQLRHE